MEYILIYIHIYLYHKIKQKPRFCRKNAQFMITRLSIAFEDFLGSSIAPQVMPPCPPLRLKTILIEAYNEMQVQNWKRSKSRNLPKFSISRHLLISKKVSRLESIVFERKYGNWFLNHQWLFFCGNISDLLTYFSFEISCLAQKQKPNP